MSCYRQYSGAFYLLHFGIGGEKAIKAEDYADLLTRAARTGLVDLVDVGVFMEEEAVRKIICAVHSAGVRVVGSNHHFDRTPDKEDIVDRLRRMQELGGNRFLVHTDFVVKIVNCFKILLISKIPYVKSGCAILYC